jgi:hypothetical protein
MPEKCCTTGWQALHGFAAISGKVLQNTGVTGGRHIWGGKQGRGKVLHGSGERSDTSSTIKRAPLMWGVADRDRQDQASRRAQGARVRGPQRWRPKSSRRGRPHAALTALETAQHVAKAQAGLPAFDQSEGHGDRPATARRARHPQPPLGKLGAPNIEQKARHVGHARW